MRKIIAYFPDFDKKMVVEMDERNKSLCNEVWDSLPFTVILEHAMVSGQSMYGWAPLISVAAIPIKILRTESPLGWVSFNQGTGNKISFKYGEISEDLYGNSLGFVGAQYLNDLAMVGREVWLNYFGEKNIYTVVLDKGEYLP